MWSQALPKWISRSSRDRGWVLNGESEDSESEDGGFADGDCRYRSSRFGFGRPSIVPCRGAVDAFLHGMAFCIACTAETYAYPKTYAYPNAHPNPWRALTGNKLGFRAWIQQAVRADCRLALSRQWVWIPYGFHICAQLAIGNRQQVCTPYPSIQPVFHRYQSGRRIVVHSATVRRPDNEGESAQSQEKRSRICSAVP